jgi:hypothetical protein
MHETARHAIHSFETLTVSVETMEAMQHEVIHLPTRYKRAGGNHAEASRQIQTHIDFQIRMLRSLSLRSQSNKERLQNEIALVSEDASTLRETSINIVTGIQFNRPTRQPDNERRRRSSKARQWRLEDDWSSNHGVLTSDVPISPYFHALTTLFLLIDGRLYSA